MTDYTLEYVKEKLNSLPVLVLSRLFGASYEGRDSHGGRLPSRR